MSSGKEETKKPQQVKEVTHRPKLSKRCITWGNDGFCITLETSVQKKGKSKPEVKL